MHLISYGCYTIKWTRLSCKHFRDNRSRLQLHVLGSKPDSFSNFVNLPKEIVDCTLTKLHIRLI